MRAPALGLMLVALAAGPAAAQDARVIPEGVTAGGVALGGLTVDEATAKLEADRALAERLRAPLVLGAAGIEWKLTMERAELVHDARATAERAALATPPAAPAGDSSGGTQVGVDVPLALSFSRAAVREWVREVVAPGTYRKPRSAKLRMTLVHMLVTRHKPGYRLHRQRTIAQVARALPTLDVRRLHQRLVKIEPKTRTDELRDAYPVVLTVDQRGFRLRLFRRLKIAKRYPIAVGMAAYPTPNGRFTISNKAVNPAWTKPNSGWVPADQRGDVVPGGAPDNPLKARWLGIVEGVGIHGTSEDWSIGTRASHGCIRMRIADVIDLYERVPVGTPVLIG